MRARSLLRVAFAISVMGATSIVAACSSDDPGHPHPGQPEAGPVGCADDPRVTAFASGLQAKSASGRFVAEIVNATPSPPQRGAGDAGMNDWTMKFTLDGNAAPPATSITVNTLMPDHGHGSPVAPTVAPNPDGTYSVSRLYLFMAGVWEIRFLSGGEEAMFAFCLQ